MCSACRRGGKGRSFLQSADVLEQREDGGTLRVDKHWKQFPRNALESPSLETLRTQLDMAQGKM